VILLISIGILIRQYLSVYRKNFKLHGLLRLKVALRTVVALNYTYIIYTTAMVVDFIAAWYSCFISNMELELSRLPLSVEETIELIELHSLIASMQYKEV
jgi:hypothetical protein